MIKNIFVPLLAALFLVGSLAGLSACNTMAGAGADIQKGGAAIKDEANEHR
jgi:predicted small secreted protein